MWLLRGVCCAGGEAEESLQAEVAQWVEKEKKLLEEMKFYKLELINREDILVGASAKVAKRHAKLW